MIELDPSHLFGKGTHRECYIHPDDERLCIKVSLKGGERETQREVGYCRHLKRRNISWDLLPMFHGCVETNLGEGVVFELIRDYDGGISETLENYLESPTLTESNLVSLARLLRSLKDYMMAQGIITRRLKAKNILYHRTDTENARLVLIDNTGNTDFIPVCSYISYFATRKIARKWQRFESDIWSPRLEAASRLLSASASNGCARRHRS